MNETGFRRWTQKQKNGIAQIRAMKTRPLMYAQTREGFLFTVSIILELLFDIDRRDFEYPICKKWNTMMALSGPESKDFTNLVCTEAIKIIYAPMK